MVLSSIKKWSYNKELLEKKDAIGVSSSQTSINTGSKVGIIYAFREGSAEKTIASVKDTLRTQNRIVSSLAFVDKKEDTDGYTFKAYSRTHLKWNGIPQGPPIDEFLSRNYDLLICPERNISEHMRYVLDLTTSRLKIGLNVPCADDLYDIIIDTSPEKDLKFIFTDIFKQLEIISE